MLVTRLDPITGKTNTYDLDVTPREIKLWVDGDESGDRVFIQDALPRLNADEREFIKTGINIGTFDDLFKDEGEDENADARAEEEYWDNDEE